MNTNVDYKSTDAEVEFTITLEGTVHVGEKSLTITDKAKELGITKEDIIQYFKDSGNTIEKEDCIWSVELKLPKNNVSGKGELIAYDFEKAFASYKPSVLNDELPNQDHFEVTKNPDAFTVATVDVNIYSRQSEYWLDIDVDDEEDEYANPEGTDPIETIHVEVEPKKSII